MIADHGHQPERQCVKVKAKHSAHGTWTSANCARRAAPAPGAARRERCRRAPPARRSRPRLLAFDAQNATIGTTRDAMRTKPHHQPDHEQRCAGPEIGEKRICARVGIAHGWLSPCSTAVCSPGRARRPANAALRPGGSASRMRAVNVGGEVFYEKRTRRPPGMLDSPRRAPAHSRPAPSCGTRRRAGNRKAPGGGRSGRDFGTRWPDTKDA